MLVCATLLAGDFFFSYLPDREQEKARERQRVSDILSTPVVDLLSRGETDRLTNLLESTVRQDKDMISVGVRRSDGQLIVATADHPKVARVDRNAPIEANSTLVSIDTASGPWGSIEARFAPPAAGILAFLQRNPGIAAVLTIIFGGSLSIGLYMRRVLQQFDPNAVIPERVSMAFDVMTEGVAIVDAEGRIALVNRRLRELGGLGDMRLTAVSLSNLPWLSHILPEALDQHPWHRCIRSGQRVTGHELVIDLSSEMAGHASELRHIVVNCAPIADGSHRVRGCMVTFDDVSDLHRTNHELAVAMEHLRESRAEVEQKAADLERLASVDYLSGVLNRRAFAAHGKAIFARMKEGRRPLACLMVDIDFFKKVNDTFGHGVGDDVIRMMATVLSNGARERDLVGRFGGEEFCMLLPDTGISTARDIAENLRETVQRTLRTSVAGLKGNEVTISIGLAVLERRHLDVTELIESADAALYEAKGSGRNRVCVASSGVPA